MPLFVFAVDAEKIRVFNLLLLGVRLLRLLRLLWLLSLLRLRRSGFRRAAGAAGASGAAAATSGAGFFACMSAYQMGTTTRAAIARKRAPTTRLRRRASSFFQAVSYLGLGAMGLAPPREYWT